MKTLKRSCVLAVALSALLCAGCKQSGSAVVKTVEGSDKPFDGVKVYKFGTGQFRRINIDGVDCVIGAGSYDNTAAVSCDWLRKDGI